MTKIDEARIEFDKIKVNINPLGEIIWSKLN